mmetsp:Transcript_74818/g.173352  ORF Transcript_74818/g.173352 Transcript_74818/m.173352 type:complete len:208 (+) Transcript_74818:1521-2144(+)
MVADVVSLCLSARVNTIDHSTLAIRPLRDDAEARRLHAGRLKSVRAVDSLRLAFRCDHELCTHELWGHDLCCADATLGEGIFDHFGHAKVDQLHLSACSELTATHQNVLCLEVTVDNFLVVDELQAISGLLDHAADNVLSKALTLALDILRKLPTLDELHDNHDVLSLRGARSEGIVATNTCADVGMALDPSEHVRLFSNLTDLRLS